MAESNGRSEHTEALYRTHGAAVAAFCRSLLRDRAEAEDAAQQVFLSAHRALLNGAAPREPLAWLLAVARHECYARFRQRAAAPVPTGAAPEGATADVLLHVLRAGDLARVWEEVERMPPAQRDAFLLREIRGLSYAQLADELSLSRPSVRSLLLRARARLRQRLGDVATALGGVPWVQTLFRLLAGGDGTSTVPVATKAVAVGLGAAALTGGANTREVAHHALRAGPHVAAHHRVETAPRRVAVSPPAAVPNTRREDRSRRDGPGSGSRDDGGADTRAAAPVVQPTTSDGHDGGGTSSSGSGPNGSGLSGPGSGDSTSSVSDTSDSGSSSSDGGSSGSGSGSVTTTTSSGSGDSGSGSGSTDGGGGSHDGGGSSGSDDDSGSHGG